ncbi:MAG: hypothetical protein ACMXX8_01180 [Candidatus Woesearchaeota archaeon]
MVRINIEIKNEIHKKAKINSIVNNKTLIEYVNEAIKEKIKKEKLKWQE